MATANEAMIGLWNDANAKRWLSQRNEFTKHIEPFGAAAIRKLAPRRGETVLDIGCGCGETTAVLAGLTGDALGVDVSAPFLEVAKREAPPGARYMLADAQSHQFDEKFDLLFSRFGIMFFDDPAAAFKNLHAALKPGARFAAAVWAPFEENTWARTPLEVVRRHIPGPASPSGPGPFALSDAGKLRTLLKDFRDVQIERIETRDAMDPANMLRMGPASAALREAGKTPWPELEAEVRQAMPDGMLSISLIVSAVRP